MCETKFKYTHLWKASSFQFFLKVYLARLVLGKVTKTAFPCCLAVAFFVCMPDSQCVQDFLGVGENLISIGLDLFLENIVWESPTTLFICICWESFAIISWCFRIRPYKL